MSELILMHRNHEAWLERFLTIPNNLAQFFYLPSTYHRGRARSTLSANFSALTLSQTNTKMHISMSLRLVATAITDTGSVDYVIYHNMKGQSLRVVSYDGKTAVANVEKYCFLETILETILWIKHPLLWLMHACESACRPAAIVPGCPLDRSSLLLSTLRLLFPAHPTSFSIGIADHWSYW